MPDVPAARSALRILRLLAQRGQPMPAAVIAREIGLPRSSVYQLARAMMDEGFLVHYPEDRAYGLSDLVVEMGSASMQSDRLGRLAHPLMERLVTQAAVPVVAHLAVLTGAEVTYVDKVAVPRAPTTVSTIGVRLPAHLTATGRAMLAGLSTAQVRALYPSRDSLVRRVGPGPRTLGDLDQLLAGVRERGWAAEDGDVMGGYSSVGAAALDRNGHPVAAIGLTYRSEVPAGTEAALGALVVTTAAALSARMTGR